MNVGLPGVLFAGCSLCVFWILAGYPLLLDWKARRWSRPPSVSPVEPSITAIIPVHNGEQFLAAKLDSVLSSDYPPDKLEVIVLSDASTDDTDSIAVSYASTGRVRFTRLPKGGKAVALSVAFHRYVDLRAVKLLLGCGVRFRDPPGMCAPGPPRVQ